MSIYSGILRRTALPYLLSRDKRQSAAGHYRFLLKSQYWSKQQLVDLQWRKLQTLLKHCYEHSQHYQKMLDEWGISPDSIKSLDDLPRLPIMTKDIFFDYLEQCRCQTYDLSQLQKFSSGGSTGQRVSLYRDQESFNIKLAAAWRNESFMGKQPCDKMALVWPAYVDFVHRVSFKERIKNRYLLRQQIYYAGSPKVSVMEDLYRQMKRFRPRFMKVFPAAFYALSEYIRDEHLTLTGLAAIQSTGEPLFDYQRALFEELYDCPVFDMYGSREVGNTGCECSVHAGLHIAMETSIVEFVDNDKPVEPGQEGDIVITDLTNFALPMIRYRIDDRGALVDRQCSCGRGLQLMSSAVGRDTDDFWGADGTRHSGQSLNTHLVDDGPVFGQMQVEQRAINDFLVRITDRPQPTQEHFDYVMQTMQKILGADIQVSFEVVDSIPREKSGKTRFLICRIDPPSGDKPVPTERPSL